MKTTKELMAQWLIEKEKEQEAQAARMNIEIALYKAVAEKQTIPKEGTSKFEDDGLKLTLTSRLDYKVDQARAVANPELFVTKYEYSKTLAKTLTHEQIAVLGDIITVKPSKPTFKVEATI